MKYRSIDLFAGIGGIRLGVEQAFGDDVETVFVSEWNKYSNQTYAANFEDPFPIVGDITEVPSKEIPDHDILLAGFPCQPFSIAGVSKKNSLGRATGFADETQGTLFFDVARIIDAKKPRAFLLENVKNLVSHDKGNTFKVIMSVLTEDLGYHVYWKIIDGKNWTPQHRERIYIVGFLDDVPFSWDDLDLPKCGGGVFADVAEQDVPDKYTLSDKLWEYLRNYAERHKARGNGFGYGLVGPEDTTRTISARYYKDGSEVLVRQEGKNPRRLTPRECARLQGFPDSFEIPVSDTQAYRQFGNSVCVPAVAEVARLMKKALEG
ncbi:MULTISPECIES: DNA (cytosine-5-)-methyltransferase [Atopobiaceae]|uniref:Cytosine-specific methyltransferase n=1 Tax=Parafannyhessea umbonata TaxID=604330 RepID=A0A1H6JXE9_9ACTN|nr:MULTISPECIES: DNA (cytosine-5-)-methyltransferase [Atopobiaceae]SEH63984.1 DNA (cytosine-5)-methyltransferase 1 [Parafannyhessea umbonata]SJZ83231.1 DNA (cytosine-5)-methyltransferase 1 [Olsenella sp. KH1P3]